METTQTMWDVAVAQARCIPQVMAVRGECEYTYRELVDRADALAVTIQSYADAGSVVAVEASTSGAAVVALLAAARVHCPALPINPDSPPAHRAMMMADGQPSVIVREVEGGGVEVVPLSPDDAEADEPAPSRSELEQVAYVIYTSG